MFLQFPLRGGLVSISAKPTRRSTMIATLILAAILILVVGTVLAGLAFGFRTLLHYRGQRLVTCPENHETAAVHVNAAKAASSRLVGRPEIRLEQCAGPRCATV
jgi:hypothetical protein